jgi:hypothetical protein
MTGKREGKRITKNNDKTVLPPSPVILGYPEAALIGAPALTKPNWSMLSQE